jgi:hypothetical protein
MALLEVINLLAQQDFLLIFLLLQVAVALASLVAVAVQVVIAHLLELREQTVQPNPL